MCSCLAKRALSRVARLASTPSAEVDTFETSSSLASIAALASLYACDSSDKPAASSAVQAAFACASCSRVLASWSQFKSALTAFSTSAGSRDSWASEACTRRWRRSPPLACPATPQGAWPPRAVRRQVDRPQAQLPPLYLRQPPTFSPQGLHWGQVLHLAKRECNLDAGDDELLRFGCTSEGLVSALDGARAVLEMAQTQRLVCANGLVFLLSVSC